MLTLKIYLKKFWESQSDELEFVNYEKHFTNSEVCNIYIVGSRPRVIIDITYCEVVDNCVDLIYKIQDGHNYKTVKGRLPLNRTIKGKVILESEFPNSRFTLKDDVGYLFDEDDFIKDSNLKIKAGYALRQSQVEEDISEYTNLNILYIGKSLKMDKTISPVERVKNHKKIQMILDKCNTTYIDKEIYIMLCAYVKKIDLISEIEDLLKIGDTNKILEKANKDLEALNATKELITQVGEAGLIDYFKPEFNNDYIGSFGRNTHTYYKYINRANLNNIVIETDLRESGTKVYTKTISPKFHHGSEYNPKFNYERNDFSADHF